MDKQLLPRPFITDICDQQNAEIAKSFFCKKVQKIMELNGDFHEAEFIQIVRQWYKACDECGLHPNERVNRWISMHNFLLKDVDFNSFPMPSTHVKGIPYITFEGILQGISTRLSLYGIPFTCVLVGEMS